MLCSSDIYVLEKHVDLQHELIIYGFAYIYRVEMVRIRDMKTWRLQHKLIIYEFAYIYSVVWC